MVSFLLTFLFVRDNFPSGFCSMQSEMPVLVYCRSLKLNIRTPKPIPKTQPTVTGMEPKVRKCSVRYLGVRIQCVEITVFVQKLQILDKLEKSSIFIFVSKLTRFSGKKLEKFEFSRLN